MYETTEVASFNPLTPSAKIIADFYEIFPTISTCLNNEKTFSGQFFKMSRFWATVVAFFDHLGFAGNFWSKHKIPNFFRGKNIFGEFFCIILFEQPLEIENKQ